MRQIFFFAAAIVLAAGVVAASDGPTVSISGTIYDDPQAIALPNRLLPVAGVTVRLYRDGGDAIPSVDDALTKTTTTNGAGLYSFEVDPGGAYWVAVDSKTLGRGTTGRAWAEQTFGPAGALCAQPDGTWRTNFISGVCIGGRRVDVSDDPTALPSAEHVAGVRMNRGSVHNLDFAFSFNVVTTTLDAVREDAPVQGSLRQFIENANAVKGANVMRFVPIARPTQEAPGTMQAETARWWLLGATGPFPEITDDETVVDGGAYSFLSPLSAVDRNHGHAGMRPALAPFLDNPAPRQERPELEITTSGEEGLACRARCVIRLIAIRGSRVAIVTRADARIEHVMIGTRGDGAPGDQQGDVGVQVEGGRTIAEHLLIEVQKTAGIAVVKAEARLDGRFLDIGYCGHPPATGAAVALFANDSTVRDSVLHQNEGAAVVIGNPDGSTIAAGNTLDSNTISRNGAGVVLSRGALRNTVARNMIMWNRAGGVVAAPGEGPMQHANRITENLFNENGLRPIILSPVADANALAEGVAGCVDDHTVPNGGLAPPRITVVRREAQPDGEYFVIRGTGCPGRTVELYRSFVTRAVRRASESNMVRKKSKKNDPGDETLTIVDSGIRAVSSIGEFNFVGRTAVAADGSFEVKVPFQRLQERRRSSDPEQFEIWADEALGTHDPNDSAFSSLTIDAEGNTSEISSRRAPLRK